MGAASEGAGFYRRRTTREVAVGDVGIGGRNPIRIQSMTTPATRDVPATASEIGRLVEAGCEIVRVTVPTSADAEALPRIRAALAARGVRVPLVADVHFTPAVAMKAVEHVQKVRINPGNFADKKISALREYGEAEYREELERIARVFSPLVLRCKELGVAMRIGANHGSLSDRILNRYGDTPEGMVESALEFVRIGESLGYREIVLSMKASNPVVVLRAYRLLVSRMDEEGMDYPLHLGVTEAGDGEDGRVKSAIGIGALLEEGIGDTVRVSLTEDPVAEIPVAIALVAPYNARIERAGAPGAAIRARPEESRRRKTRPVRFGPVVAGGGAPPIVEVPLRSSPADERSIRSEVEAVAGGGIPEDARADLVSIRVATLEDAAALPPLRRFLERAFPALALSVELDRTRPLESLLDAREVFASASHRIHLRIPVPIPEAEANALDALLEAAAARGAAVLFEVGARARRADDALELATEVVRRHAGLRESLAIAIDPEAGSPLLVTRALADRLDRADLDTPIVLVDRPGERGVDNVLGPASALGGLLGEGIGDAIHIETEDPVESRRLAFTVLQAARARITRTEFISCPSCGRTLFDLKSTARRIQSRTAHLKGLKIAIMGCVVNGPGEMADADFGYVGWGDGKIALFVGRDLVEKDIPAEEAEDRLVELIRRRGLWVDPPEGGVSR